MKRLQYILIGIVVLACIILVVRFSGPEDTWVCIDSVWVKHGNPTVTAPVLGCGNNSSSDSTIKLYFYNSKLDQGAGGVQCSKKGLVSVNRVIPKTSTPLQDSLNLLLRGELSDEEKTQGISTEFPLPGLALKNAVIKDGIATLTFDDPQNKTSGGSCRAGILWFQIEVTVKQFPNVTTVEFMPKDLFQP